MDFSRRHTRYRAAHRAHHQLDPHSARRLLARSEPWPFLSRSCVGHNNHRDDTTTHYPTVAIYCPNLR